MVSARPGLQMPRSEHTFFIRLTVRPGVGSSGKPKKCR